MVAADKKDLISRRTGRNVTMSGWIKIGAEFITALTHQWKGSSHPNLPSETTNSMAAEDLAPGVDGVAVRPESQISGTRINHPQRRSPSSDASSPKFPPTSKKSSVAAKSCDIFSMIFGCPPTTNRGHSTAGMNTSCANDATLIPNLGALRSTGFAFPSDQAGARQWHGKS
jgi:hypothetical protein